MQSVYVCVMIGSIRCVNGEGMPHHRNPFEKGNLIIKFDIEFPQKYFTDAANIKVSIMHIPTYDTYCAI